MVLNNKEILLAYEPYRKEASHSFVTMVGAMACCIVVLIPFCKEIPKVLIVLGLSYLLLILFATIFIYRFSLLSIYEKRCCRYIRKEVRMTAMSDEYSPSGKYESIIPRLYPAGLRVQRHKIRCLDSDGNKLLLRRAMGGKNAQLLMDEIFNGGESKRTVIYGKYTHIIVSFCDKDDTAFWMNHRI